MSKSTPFFSIGFSFLGGSLRTYLTISLRYSVVDYSLTTLVYLTGASTLVNFSNFGVATSLISAVLFTASAFGKTFYLSRYFTPVPIYFA